VAVTVGVKVLVGVRVMVGVRVTVAVSVRVAVGDTAGVWVDVGGTGQVGIGWFAGQDCCVVLTAIESNCAVGAAFWNGSDPQPAKIKVDTSQITILCMIPSH
jgi:hypothetical protein